ncbi:hypothetical protein [Nocardiopsis sp. CC223A]|uniref:hypothetical protein n=1 Tax=Nocardiopsis sp. CC223A TaxID=3044051 RepID=UPI002795D82D|nr:hypothetical protein [Nocardiopsis sp. CC223A]
MTLADPRTLFDAVRDHPGAFGFGPSFGEAVAFLVGYDVSTPGGPLTGFREWLAADLGFGSNLTWQALVLWRAFPDEPDRRAVLPPFDDPAVDAVAVEVLFEALNAFLDFHRDHGLDAVYARYSELFPLALREPR